MTSLSSVIYQKNSQNLGKQFTYGCQFIIKDTTQYSQMGQTQRARDGWGGGAGCPEFPILSRCTTSHAETLWTLMCRGFHGDGIMQACQITFQLIGDGAQSTTSLLPGGLVKGESCNPRIMA